MVALGAVGRARGRCAVRRRGASFAAVLALLLAGLARPAAAHEPFQITTDVRALSDRLMLHVTLASRTATLACPAAVGAVRSLEPGDFERARRQLEACAKGLYVVTSAGRKLEPLAVEVSLTQEGDFDARLRYPPAAPGPLTLDAVHLARLPDAMFGAEVTVTGDRVFLGQELLRPSAHVFTVRVPAFGEVPARSAPHVPSFGEYLALGVQHILTGADHLAFVLALLVVCRRLRNALAVVTAFTVAHSLTLALAALGLVALPSRVVEPLIAVTIVAVALENLWRGEQLRWRWALAGAFGLIHGFGFASALRDAGLGRNGAPIALPLFAFNLGVEVGQVCVAALVLPVLLRLRHWPPFARHGPKAISAAVGVLGCVWLVERLAR